MDHKTFSQKGGSSKSEAKKVAAKANLQKALEALRKKREEQEK